VTAHYIDNSPDEPLRWELKSRLLGFEEIKGNHGGANIAATILAILDQYGIRNKVRNYFSVYFIQLISYI
jgi:hypothetical protein